MIRFMMLLALFCMAKGEVRTTVKGNILSTEDYFEKGQEPGMKLNLKTESGEIQIQLGPQWVKFRNDLQFAQGEPITVIGLKIQLGSKSGVEAEQIYSQKKALKLRDIASGK